ncbi:MAG: penicillin-binding transpeptidase domain-containing protein, partial [Chloroflexota bacterium]
VVASALANGGELLKPRIVAATRGSDGLHPTPRVVHGRVPVDASHFAEVRTAMLEAAKDTGTAFTGRPQGLNIGAKTGTAEFGTKLPDGSYDSHGWFMAFAPYEQPEVAVVVYLEHGVGATHAGPVAKRILEAYFAGRLPQAAVTPVGTKR